MANTTIVKVDSIQHAVLMILRDNGIENGTDKLEDYERAKRILQCYEWESDLEYGRAVEIARDWVGV